MIRNLEGEQLEALNAFSLEKRGLRGIYDISFHNSSPLCSSQFGYCW